MPVNRSALSGVKKGFVWATPNNAHTKVKANGMAERIFTVVDLFNMSII
jgi:hypothetical protein